MNLLLAVFCLFFISGCLNRDTYQLQGYIEGEFSNLSSSQSGSLQTLYVTRGQTVVKGQHLFDLDPEPEQSALIQAAANLESEQSKLKDLSLGQRSTILGGIIAQREQAEADLELAKNDFNRSEQLYQKGVVSKANYDQALSTLKAAEQKVTQYQQNLKEAELGERQYRLLQQMDIVRANEAALKQAKWRLTQKSVYAPEAGLIFDTYFNIGEQIAANQAVASLLAPRNIYLIFYVPEPRLSTLRLNQWVSFKCDSCQRTLIAKITYISAEAEYTPPVIFSEVSRQKLVYRVKANLLLKEATWVHPGQPVEITLSRKGIDRLSPQPTTFFKRVRQWLTRKK